MTTLSLKELDLSPPHSQCHTNPALVPFLYLLCLIIPLPSLPSLAIRLQSPPLPPFSLSLSVLHQSKAMPENSVLCDVSRGHTHRSALADICAQHDYTARNHPSTSAPSQVLQRPPFNFRWWWGIRGEKRIVSMFFGISVSICRSGVKAAKERLLFLQEQTRGSI